MAKTKGTDVAALREVLHQRGPEVEAAVLKRMDPAARALYEKALAFDWSPVDLQMQVYLAAARHLFPDSPQPMAELGRLLANKAYGGIYKVFLRIPTVKYVMNRTAQLWSTYYDTGQATVENVTDTGLDVVVRGFPDLPAPMREMAGGHMGVLLELTGAKGGRVTVDDHDPAEWHWQLRWD
jgi:hypothetical protein